MCFWITIFLAALGSASSLYIGSSPYNLLLIFTSTFYLGIGNLMKKYLTILYKQITSQKLLVYMIVCFLLSLGYLFNLEKTIEYASNQLGYGLPSIISGLGGSLFICAFANFIYRVTKGNSHYYRVFLFAGKNSYTILAFHQLFLAYCSLYIRPAISNYVIYKSVEFAIVASLCYLSILLINKHLPWMLGRANSQKV